MQISEYSQPIKPFDYQPPVPVQLMMSIMDSKSKTMANNLNALQSNINQLGQLDVARDVDKALLNNKVSNLVGNINKMGGQDISDPNIFSGINAMSNTISGDKQLVNAVAQTKMMRNELQAADEARKSDKDWAQQNENYLYKQVQGYLNSSGEQAKFSGKWLPYFDYNKELQGAYEQMKANSTYKQKLDGSFGLFTEKGEEITPERVHDYLNQKINADPRIRQQLAIDADDSYGNAPTKNIVNGYLPIAQNKLNGYNNAIAGLNADMASLKNSPDFITNKEKQAQYQSLQATANQYTQESAVLTKKVSDPAALISDIENNKAGYGMEIFQYDLGRQFADQFAYSKTELNHLASFPKGKTEAAQQGAPLGDAIMWDPAGDNNKHLETESSLQQTIDTYQKKTADIKLQLYNDIHQEYGNAIKSPAQIDAFIKQQEQLIADKQFDKVSPEYKQVRNQLVQARLEMQNAKAIISDVNGRVDQELSHIPEYKQYLGAHNNYDNNLKSMAAQWNQGMRQIAHNTGHDITTKDLDDFVGMYGSYIMPQHGESFDMGLDADTFIDYINDKKFLGLSPAGHPEVNKSNKIVDILKHYDHDTATHIIDQYLSPLLRERNQAAGLREGLNIDGKKQQIYDADYSYASQVPYRSFDYLTTEKQGGDKGALASMRNLIAQYGDPSDLKKAKDNDITPRWVGNDEAGNVYVKYSIGDDQQMHQVKISPENASVFQSYLGSDRYPAVTHALLTKGETISNKPGEDIAANALSVFVPVYDPTTKKFLYDKPLYVRLYNTAKASAKAGPQSALNVRVQYIDPSSGISDWVGMKDERGNAPSFSSVEQALNATQMLFTNLANANIAVQPYNRMPQLNP